MRPLESIGKGVVYFANWVGIPARAILSLRITRLLNCMRLLIEVGSLRIRSLKPELWVIKRVSGPPDNLDHNSGDVL